MPEMRNDIDQLIVRYMRGDLSVAEQQLLFDWRDMSAANRELFERLTSKEWLTQEFTRMSAYTESESAAWEKLKAGIAPQSVEPAKVIPVFRRWRMVAAAVVVAVLAGGAWFAYQVREKTLAIDKQEVRFKNDLPPGKEGAVLTLADGSIVLLDTAENGKLAEQGKMHLVKSGGALTYYGNGAGEKLLYNTITTARGRKFKLELSDGSIVILNAASSISFPTAFPDSARVVEIKGEAYFEVAKKKNPFRVVVNGAEIQVLGTHFNVNAYPEAGVMKTTLLEGSVRVVQAGAGSMQDPVILVPGQQAVITKGSAGISTAEVDVEEAVSWKNGMFWFHNSSISSVMQELERWYDFEVEYETQVQQHFSGTIPQNVSLVKVLQILELTKGVKFRVEGKKVTVMKN